jgi:hypothetical protein
VLEAARKAGLILASVSAYFKQLTSLDYLPLCPKHGKTLVGDHDWVALCFQSPKKDESLVLHHPQPSLVCSSAD